MPIAEDCTLPDESTHPLRNHVAHHECDELRGIQATSAAGKHARRADGRE